MKRILSCLVIDDDEDDLEIFLLCVRQVSANIDCRTANNGHEALLMFESDKEYAPGYIFLDVNMPKMNGKQLLKELKNDTHFKFIPVFIYSTSSNNEDKRDTIGNGAADFIVKPNSYSELCKILEETTQSIQL